MSATMCRTAAVLTVPLAAGAGARRHQIAQSTTNTNTVSSTRVALRASRRLAVMRAKDSDDVDWEAKTKEMTAERVIEKCMEAMADGDEDLLQSCLLELEEPEEKASVMESLMEEKSDDEFWKNKLSEIAAERVLDNCMSAVMYGEVDDIEDCMLDAQNDTLLSADFSTAEDGSKTFKF